MLAKLKTKIRVFFGFSSSETNGLLLLIPIILIILLIPSVLRIYLQQESNSTTLEDEALLKSWLEESRSKLRIEKKHSMPPTPFNPNKISKAEWVALGFEQKVANRILNYLQKGGSFKKKEDLLKIYGINKKLARTYFDNITIPAFVTKEAKIKSKPDESRKEFVEKKSLKYDLNTSDTSRLQRVKGLGPVLSSRIIRYREALGGFHNLDQIKEVYGINLEVYLRMLNYFVLPAPQVKKININQDSIKLLAKHPYLTYKLSKAIKKFRSQHGDFQSIEELKTMHAVSDSLFQKMAPYLTVLPVE